MPEKGTEEEAPERQVGNQNGMPQTQGEQGQADSTERMDKMKTQKN